MASTLTAGVSETPEEREIRLQKQLQTKHVLEVAQNNLKVVIDQLESLSEEFHMPGAISQLREVDKYLGDQAGKFNG